MKADITSPLPDAEETNLTMIMIPRETFESLTDIAIKRNISTVDAMNEALQDYIEKYGA